MKHFESLNNEKITPYFLGLAKRPQNSECLSDINQDDGTPFDNRNVRSDYIKSYYENIYKRVPVDITDQSINNFLGDTADHPEVLGSKLSENEREELEQDLTILEFDKAVESAKNNTAPGIDSISNKFIKTFWPFFRKPLFDYTKHCYNRGTLTDNFRSAKIRLIPKKGDLTKLSNWRPISLLNCFYKIISRVIATRLRKVMDKITKVAQKGFSSNKYCQEVLIGIVDSINTVKHTGRNGALISLDIKKAFDSTSHSYLQQVYKFFNFGPNFIRWLNLVCTNRRACIILENEYYSEFFDLERGNAQGDTISPYIFNLGFQILLFKLNFDLQIDGIVNFPRIPDNIPPPQATVSTYQRKISAYADDANMFVSLDYETISRIKTILEQFGNLSGLICNVEKTTLLTIGQNNQIDDRIRNLGFIIVDKVTILGLEINSDGVANSNFTRLVEKIRSLIANWTPYKLSLPGRINIAKSLMYSQINYLGCFLQFPTEYINSIDNIITGFVKGKLNIARKRLYLSPKDGGLGLFDIPTFLHAQRCAWVKRCISFDEQWKVQLFINNFGNVFNCKSCNTNQLTNPVLFAISASFEIMCNSFVPKDENFRKSFIVDNKKMTRDIDSNNYISKNFFGREFFHMHANKLYNLRYLDFYTEDDVMIPADTVINNTGIPLTVLMIQTLRGVCNVAKIKYVKRELDERVCVDVRAFMMRSKRGSKRIRLVMTQRNNINTPHNINKFAQNMDIIITGSQSTFLNALWTNNFFDNNMKMFLFKLHNNTLGYNNAVAHFVAGHSPCCTFCDAAGDADINTETGLHLFFDCVHVSDIVENIFSRVTTIANFPFSRREYFSTFERREFTHSKNLMLTLLAKITMKVLWDCKLRFVKPTIDICWDNVRDSVNTLINNNKRFAKIWENSGLSV
jgi:hypothetical protein